VQENGEREEGRVDEGYRTLRAVWRTGGEMRLEGKVSLITGGGSGMGMVAAKLFAAEGARVVLTDVIDEAGEKTRAEIEKSGGQAIYVHADVSVEGDAEAMVTAAVERFGRLDVLYNNAGVMLGDDGSVHVTSEEIWDRTLGVNVKGVAFGCKYGVPAMIASGGGSIINVASFVAWMGAATSQTAYTASKGAVLAMTREIAVEYARKGIRCNALCPGPIDTPLLAELLADPERRQRRFVHIPMGRLGQAEELAKAALFLASEDSSFMTGTSLIVDGGITAAYVTPED
jgi:NAD(P)-dependent dehydrogenase (short-subunit alcohol dehydrogenase family)